MIINREDWIDVKKQLPPVNTIVKVLLANGCEAFDFVNEPVAIETPFQHYIVSKWRYATREELNNLLNRR